MSMAAYGLGIVLAPVLGPTLGGWLTDTFSWRYASTSTFPVGILAVCADHSIRTRSAVYQECQSRPLRQHRLWTADGVDRRLQIVLDKGQEDDWFGAVWVRWAVAALVVALIGWIWHSWTHPKGLVDLHVLKDRNFRTGCFLIALLGMCIYITIAILPLYYQEILGYTAFTAGLVVGPRGIGSFIGSPVVGFLGSRIDNRKLLSRGFWLRGLRSGLWNRQSGHWTVHTADSDHRDGLCTELCVCADVDDDDGDHQEQGHGSSDGPGEHAPQYWRLHRDFDGHDCGDPAGGAAPE